MKNLIILLLSLLPFLGLSQDRILLFDGTAKSGKVLDLSENGMVFMDQEQNTFLYGPKDVSKVYLDESNQRIISILKNPQLSSMVKGKRDGSKRTGMKILHAGSGFLAGLTGIFPLSPIETKGMIRSQLTEEQKKKKAYSLGYTEAANKSNRKALRIGMVAGILTSILSRPGQGIRIGY